MMIRKSGCAEADSKFDCPMKPGVSCSSLDQVNAKVDRGEIGFLLPQSQLITPPLKIIHSIKPIYEAVYMDKVHLFENRL